MSDASPTTVLVALTTLPDAQAAERLATTLVEERLVACANVLGDVRSVYRWKGAVETDDEVLVMLKTTEAGFEALRARLVDLHPYDVPEVLALPIAAGHVPYLSWVGDEVGAA